MSQSEKFLFIDTTGMSMWPFLRGGSKLVVRKVSPSQVALGDIIVYRNSNSFICHRVINKDLNCSEPFFILKGDALFASEKILACDLVGVVEAIVRQEKTVWLGFWHKFSGKFIAVFSLFTALMLRIIEKFKR